jgi:uracil-DNA glycosylase
VLGAYPSALHVEWLPPRPLKRIAAIPIDDEPSPFWNGADHVARMESWKALVGFDPAWGSVRAVARFNGPSGAWVHESLLIPLGCTAGDAWITDCLDTYRASVGVAKRVVDTYEPFAASCGLPEAQLSPHPSESQIVVEALKHHRERLRTELAEARPDLVVTLGNAALLVLAAIVDLEETAPAKLRIEDYGKDLGIRVAGRSVRWLPLAHPGAPPVYQAAHDRWTKLAAGLR